MMFIYTVLTGYLNFDSLQASHHGGVGCSPVLNSFCSWFYSVYYTTTIDVIKWVKNSDVEIYEMNEYHKHDDNSSNVPQDDFCLIVCCIRLMTTLNASGGSPTPNAIVQRKQSDDYVQFGFSFIQNKEFLYPICVSYRYALKKNKKKNLKNKPPLSHLKGKQKNYKK